MLSYGVQNNETVIGTVASPATLTATYTDNTKTLITGGLSMLTLVGTYTTGAAETSNYISIKIEVSDDDTNFYQTMTASSSSGVTTMYPQTFKVDGAAAGTAYPFNIQFPVAARKVKISVIETGVAANFGTLYMGVLESGTH